MSIVVRTAMMLAAVVPLYAATGFHPAWWQVFLAAIAGSLLGQGAGVLARRRRTDGWAALGAAAIIVAAALAWSVTRPGSGATGAASPQDVIVVWSSSVPGGASKLTWDDVHAIQSEIADAHVAPYLRTTAALVSEEQNWTTNVHGTTPEYFDVHDWHLASGRAFTDAESGNKVVVLGQTVADRLFGAGVSPVGQAIRIRNVPFEVVGVLAPRGQSATGQDHDDVAVVPLATFRSSINPGSQSSFGGVVLIRPEASDGVEHVQAQIAALLRDRHHLPSGEPDDFRIQATGRK